MGELEDRINSVLSDPKQMEQILDMARSLMGGEEPPKQGGGLGSLLQGGGGGAETGMLGRLSGLMNTGADGDRRALLEALGPWLSAKRREKLERAMRMARLARVASAVLGETGGGHV